MRIAFCGKGGSGKTSISSLFIRYLVNKGDMVLAIDGDINQHLGEALSIDPVGLSSLPRIGNHKPELIDYVAGTNPRIRNKAHVVESTPAGNGSNFVSFKFDDPISRKFMLANGNLRFMAIGGHDEKDVGATCYHKFTGAEGIFLNHLLDRPDEFVIGDMCAGADPFASSGLATRYDAIYLVLEPTLKSLAVYDQARKYTDPFGIKLITIGNKISAPDDLEFIEKRTGQKCAAGFSSLKAFQKLERGEDYAMDDLELPTLEALDTLRNIALSFGERDWGKYTENGAFFHKRAGDGWASSKFGYDLMEQIDPDFSYPQLMYGRKKAA